MTDISSNNILSRIRAIQTTLINSGSFSPLPGRSTDPAASTGMSPAAELIACVQAARTGQERLRALAVFMRDKVVIETLRLDSRIRKPEEYDALRDALATVVAACSEFRTEKEFMAVYGELLSVYFLSLYRCGSPGRESAIIRMMLQNIVRRKAVELSRTRLAESLEEIERKVVVAVIAKRYAAYVLVTRGLEVLLRGDVEFQTVGTSPEVLALEVTNLLVRNRVKLADVTDVVCVGGDLGTLPDGIYVLTEKIRDESWKRLHNSSLNRGALIAWELRELLRQQKDQGTVHASLCSPLSFSTLASHDLSFFLNRDSDELRRSLQGYVKCTPLKAMAALLSELDNVNQQNLNLVVMSLDELFASVVRKTGPRIIRELAAQEANRTLIDFDFAKIVATIEQEGFVIPPHFRLASRQIGTGVKEVCELIMIARSGKISPALSRSLMNVVDAYARKVDTVLEMACSGKAKERPHYVVITSMLVLDPNFQRLFGKIRNMMDNTPAPVLCMDSLEHEYLIANHLFELYVNPAKMDRRLNYSVEERSMRHALQVLGAAQAGLGGFTFASLMGDLSSALSDGKVKPANLVVVGADNEDALVAVADAKERGLIDRVALIGDYQEILSAIERCRLPLSPALDESVRIMAIDPLALDFDSKKESTAQVFHEFLHENPNYIVMKGSLDTGKLLHEALSIYKSPEPADGGDAKPAKKLASHTALFELPDGRFFALSDSAVNPSFRNSDRLLSAIENQLDVVRKVLGPEQPLKVAIITAVEKETAAIPATLLAAEAHANSKVLTEKYGPVVVEGPLSFDLATVPEVAEEKHYKGEIRGDANCLVSTDINTANVLYKMLSKTMGSLGLLVENGGIITAGPGTMPIVLTSRGDTSQTKLNSILMALAYATGGMHR